MSHGSTASLFHSQFELRSVQRLHLRFLIHTQYYGLLWRIKIYPNHIGQFLHKVPVFGDFKTSQPMRLQSMSIPDACHGCMSHTLRFCHHSGRPMGCSRGFRVQGSLHNASNLIYIQSSLAWTMRCSWFPHTILSVTKESDYQDIIETEH